ncbi:MAG: hypothetical protein JNM72_05185 [Deltaproteobacteria bacterium]|nr:hypothetical protein [Deltaproteobacteria bacterium]
MTSSSPSSTICSSDAALRAAVLRGFAAGRRRAVLYGLAMQVGALALGLAPVLSADPELARAGFVGKLALALLAGGLGIGGAVVTLVGWALPGARARQVVELVRGAPHQLVAAGRLAHVDGKLRAVEVDEAAAQQLVLVTEKGLRVRVPMAPAEITAVLQHLARVAPGAVVLGGP